MLFQYSHLSKQNLLFFLGIFSGYFLGFIHSITLAHQLRIDIEPPILSKQNKTLWIGGK